MPTLRNGARRVRQWMKSRSPPFAPANLRVDAVYGRRIAELEKASESLREPLRDLAAGALQLLETSPLRDPADAVIIGDIVIGARRVPAHLKPTRC